ncbi:MAG TPA: IS110 family transposase [Thermoleophilia bacterium]|nr:IS110 family transposase [Thermoleophilia bacterium]
MARPAVLALDRRPGIGGLTACKIAAEIIDIRRFPSESNLASYSGLGRVEFKTGNQERERAACGYNRRLKDALMTAARNVVRFDPDSHLAGYDRWLLRRGMEPQEATKRVARALVRVIYRELKALVDPRPSPAKGPRQASAPANRCTRKQPRRAPRRSSRRGDPAHQTSQAKRTPRVTAHSSTEVRKRRRVRVKESA